MRKNNLKQLYKILHDLDCELQNLGARGDYGIFATPEFAVETLVATIQFISTQPDASKGLLQKTAQDLLDTKMRRTIPNQANSYTAEAAWKAHELNTASFKTLVEAYRNTFKLPGEFQASSSK